MYHTQHAIEYSRCPSLEGFSKLHEYHAAEEFSNFLQSAQYYAKTFDEVPLMNIEKPAMIVMDGDDIHAKMVNALEDYEKWENDTLAAMESYQSALSDHWGHIHCLVADVKKELLFINEAWDEVSENTKHLWCFNKWLTKYFSE